MLKAKGEPYLGSPVAEPLAIAVPDVADALDGEKPSAVAVAPAISSEP